MADSLELLWPLLEAPEPVVAATTSWRHGRRGSTSSLVTLGFCSRQQTLIACCARNVTVTRKR